MEKVIVTGGTSFIGLELVRRLLREGIETHIIKRPNSDLSRFENFGIQPVFHNYEGSVASVSAALKASNANTVFHLAGKYVRNHSPRDIDTLIDANMRFGTHVLEAMTQSKTTWKLVNTGSHFQYGDKHVSRAKNLYAATKTAYSELVRFYCDTNNLTSITLVLFDTYGPSDWRLKLMPAIRDAQRNQTRFPIPSKDLLLDFVYIDDVTSAYLRAAELVSENNAQPKIQAYAISSGKPVRISEILRKFEAIGRTPITVEKGKWPPEERTFISNWSGPILPGWAPTVSLDEGIKRIIGIEDSD